jgi:hypothetical protein
VQLLANFGEDEKICKLVGSALKNDLWVWKKQKQRAGRGRSKQFSKRLNYFNKE